MNLLAMAYDKEPFRLGPGRRDLVHALVVIVLGSNQIRGVEVSTIGDDETSYLVRVTVESFSSKPVSINIVFAVPGSIPLDGDLT